MDYDIPKMNLTQENSLKNKCEIIKYREFVRNVTLVVN